jgi:uncharacterized protein (TIGR04168 family)
MTTHPQNTVKLAVIGDIHHQWELEDNLALEHLNRDLALFVGDFGNESVEVVRHIAGLKIPKVAIMGNHDAWYTASEWGRQQSPYDHDREDRVQQQLDLLADCHVGYGKQDFPHLNLSVLGSRPFSWGGAEWKNKRFLRDRYGVNNFRESTDRIVASARETAHDALIFLAHNGPTGLGNEPEAICGRDWPPLGGDHGDPDFAEAIAEVRRLGKSISLVTFGHMHHHLRHTRARLRTIVKTDAQGTVYLNAASVPRIVEQHGETLRNFSLVTLASGVVMAIDLVWMGENYRVAARQILYRHPEAANLSFL